MKNIQIILLTNAQIKHIHPDYIKTMLLSRRNTLNFLGESVTISMKYKVGKTQYLIFKLSNIKINSIDDLVKITMHQIENVDKNLKYDKLYLNFMWHPRLSQRKNHVKNLPLASVGQALPSSCGRHTR